MDQPHGEKETTVAQQVLVDGLGFQTTPQSEDELAQALAELNAAAGQRGEPLIATLAATATDDDPPSLGIGLGRTDSVLIYSAGGWSGEGGYSRGPRSDDTSEVTFRYGTAINEYLGWMLIPKDQAAAAAREFFRTGKQPASVTWADL